MQYYILLTFNTTELLHTAVTIKSHTLYIVTFLILVLFPLLLFFLFAFERPLSQEDVLQV